MSFLKPIMIALAVAVLGLCGWIWYQSQEIDNLRAKNQAQAQTIQAQELVNKNLTTAIIAEREAVLTQQQANEEIEREANESIETVRTIIKTQPCYSTRLPANSIERLRKQNYNKN